MIHFWVRSEYREDELRTPLTPLGAKKLLNNGIKVTIEESQKRTFSIDEYRSVGCEIANKGSWINTDLDTIILGLKELDDEIMLEHRHIMFAHIYKNQKGSKHILNNFRKNNGILYDLEYLKDANSKRVAAFGYYAGFSGAFVGLDIWLSFKENNLGTGIEIPVNTSKKFLVKSAFKKIDIYKKKGNQIPKIIVIGAGGRVGSGACDFFKSLGLKITEWDIKETSSRNSFSEILEHDIFVNCVLSDTKTVKFLKKSDITDKRELSLISDVSCDPGSDFNTIPLYDEPSSFKKPYQFINRGKNPLLLTAIDNLPAMLPKESSIDFEKQLLPYLLDFDVDKNGVWGRAKRIFYDKINIV